MVRVLEEGEGLIGGLGERDNVDLSYACVLYTLHPWFKDGLGGFGADLFGCLWEGGVGEYAL